MVKYFNLSCFLLFQVRWFAPWVHEVHLQQHQDLRGHPGHLQLYVLGNVLHYVNFINEEASEDVLQCSSVVGDPPVGPEGEVRPAHTPASTA